MWQKKSVSAQSKYVCLCGRCYSPLAAIGADRSVEHHCSLFRFDVTNLNTLYSTDLSKALVITELGSSRNPEVIDVVMSNLRRLAEKPIAVHR